jgi:hypothetical protein
VRHQQRAGAGIEERLGQAPASGVPSAAAVLQADRTTQSALSLNVAIFDAVNRPSFSGVASGGGVKSRLG